MRLYEFESKSILKDHGMSVPQSVLVGDLSELRKVLFPVVLKGQILIGARGKAGLIKSANSPDEAKKQIGEILEKQSSGHVVKAVLVEEKIPIAREFYVAATIDRVRHQPLLIVSDEGGMDIEEVARKHPEAVHRIYLKPGERMRGYVGLEIATHLGLDGSSLVSAGNAARKIYDIFIDYDCKLVEVNPLVLTTDGKIVALDAKIDLDEDAMYRHPQLKRYGIEPRHEVGELNERERIAKAAGVPYVELDGDIGTFPGGAGFGIAVLDLISHFGGKPANFMDSGGAPSQERLRLMIGLLMDNPQVKVIFGARFGGISRCDDWARAVVQYVVENKPAKPMIMRMVGNMEDEGRKIFEAARQSNPDLFRRVRIYKYDTPIEEVVKEAIREARKG